MQRAIWRKITHHGSTEDTEVARNAPPCIEKMMACGFLQLQSVYLGTSVSLIERPTSPITQRIIGSAIEVHRHLGPGLLESSYETCLCREMDIRGISYESQVAQPIEYKGIRLSKGYIMDLLVENAVKIGR